MLTYQDYFTYTYSVYHNTFEDVKITAQSSLFSIGGYGYLDNFIAFKGNKFANINAEEELVTDLIKVGAFNSLIIVQNNFTGLNGSMIVISFPKTNHSTLLEIDQNQMSDLEIASFMSIKGETLHELIFKKNIFSNIKLTIDLFSIDLKEFREDYVFENNHFSKIDLNLQTDLISTRHSFIHIFLVRKVAIKEILFLGNYFEDINLKVQGLEDSIPDIHFLLIDTEFILSFKDNTFKKIISSLLRKFFSFDTPKLTMESCTFTDLGFYSLEGMFLMQCKFLLLTDSKFKKIENKKGEMLQFVPTDSNPIILVQRNSFEEICNSGDRQVLLVRSSELQAVTKVLSRPNFQVLILSSI